MTECYLYYGNCMAKALRLTVQRAELKAIPHSAGHSQIPRVMYRSASHAIYRVREILQLGPRPHITCNKTVSICALTVSNTNLISYARSGGQDVWTDTLRPALPPSHTSLSSYKKGFPPVWPT